MNKLATSYLGLNIKNPIIISSSGLTDTAEKNLALEKAGAGAIVIKSLYEEQIMMKSEHLLAHTDYTEAYDYIKNYVHSHKLTDYLEQITASKRLCSIPIIASINCYKTGEWATFAHQIELAGADAIELNIFLLNTHKNEDSTIAEQAYIDIVRQVKKEVNIPIAVKISSQFTNLVSFSERLIAAGAKSIVLFNRYYQPDINLDSLQIVQGEIFSHQSDFATTLRWTGLISGLVKNVTIVSSTGIHSWENAIKAILVGAQAVEICSTVYKNGNNIIADFISNMENWMKKHGYENVEEFRAKLNYANSENPTLFERSQFMKYYADKDDHKGEIFFT